MQFNFLQTIVLWAVPALFAITLHEAAHGFVAARCGDKTALMLGRVTANPLKHIDPLGTILLPIICLLLPGHFVFGWAKPVPVDFRNVRKPRLHMALIAAAGPVANLLMLCVWALVARLGVSLIDVSYGNAQILMAMGMAGIWVNTILAVFNLFPLPPLDGSRIVSSFLSAKASLQYNSLERYGLIIIAVLLISGILSKILLPIMGAVVGVAVQVFGLS